MHFNLIHFNLRYAAKSSPAIRIESEFLHRMKNDKPQQYVYRVDCPQVTFIFSIHLTRFICWISRASRPYYERCHVWFIHFQAAKHPSCGIFVANGANQPNEWLKRVLICADVYACVGLRSRMHRYCLWRESVVEWSGVACEIATTTNATHFSVNRNYVYINMEYWILPLYVLFWQIESLKPVLLIDLVQFDA